MASRPARTNDNGNESHFDEMLDSVSIRAPQDIGKAAANLENIARQRDLKVALCADISSAKPMTDADGNCLNSDIFGWGKENDWWKDQEFALHCPVPRACRYESEPFWCDQNGFHGHASNSFFDDIDVQGYFSENNFVHSALIVVPVHLPFGQVSANSFPIINSPNKDAAMVFSEHANLLGALTKRIISGYAALSRQSKYIPSDCRLSKREAECIRWASVGKTDDEIGEIISVCRSTVRYHIRRAGEKLHSVNRTQTVFKATQLGFLGNGHQ